MPDSLGTPRFSVVVPTYERRELVVANVRALAAQTIDDFEVVAVVDGSRDGTAEALRELELRFPLAVVEQENQGLAAARNRGAAEASGELLLFLDDDMEADPSLLAEHDRSHRDGADVVLGHLPLHPDSPRNFLSDAVAAWAEARGRALASGEEIPIGDLVGGQMSLGAELFHRLGGFEHEFTREGAYGNEDLDFGQRLVAAGCRVVFNPRAVSRQLYVVTPRANLHQWRQAGRSAVLLARRHPGQAATLAARPRETRVDRLLLRPARVPVRESALLLVRLFPRRYLPGQWFFLARKLEYFRGIRDAGGWPGRYPVRVLCYHAVSDLTGAPVMDKYGVPPELLDSQLRFLARRFRFLTIDEFVRFLDGAGVPRRSVLVTFDDCFQDLVDAGLPVLRRHGAPALAFAVTQRLGRTNDWDLKLDAAQLPLADATGLATLADGGVAIASHTRTHPMLDEVSPAELEGELRGSLADLESLGIGALPLIAYPHGAFDGEVTRSTESAGYVAGFTVQTSLVRPGHDRFELPRLEIFPTDGPIRFRWKLVWAGRSLRRRLSRPGR